MKALIILFVVVICISPFNSYCTCVEGDCENGEGIFLYPDGSKYIGQWNNNKKNG